MIAGRLQAIAPIFAIKNVQSGKRAVIIAHDIAIIQDRYLIIPVLCGNGKNGGFQI